MMDKLIGIYKAKTAGRCAVGLSSVGFVKGAEIQVNQVSTNKKKVLVDFGDRLIDWKPIQFLNHFVKADDQPRTNIGFYTTNTQIKFEMNHNNVTFPAGYTLQISDENINNGSVHIKAPNFGKWVCVSILNKLTRK